MKGFVIINKTIPEPTAKYRMVYHLNPFGTLIFTDHDRWASCFCRRKRDALAMWAHLADEYHAEHPELSTADVGAHMSDTYEIIHAEV